MVKVKGYSKGRGEEGDGYKKIRIGEQWWAWDEKKEVLRDSRGMVRRQKLGKGTGDMEGGIKRERGRGGRWEMYNRRNTGRAKQGGMEGGFLERGGCK